MRTNRILVPATLTRLNDSPVRNGGDGGAVWYGSYDGRRYNGSSLVSGLVTLGTPHVRLEDAEGQPRVLPFSRNFKVTIDELLAMI